MSRDQSLAAAMMEGGDVEFLRSDAVLSGDLPFSDGVRVGRLVMLSGQLGVKPGTLELVPGGVETEARQTLENVRRTLEAHGLGLRDVVRVQVMLADMSEWGRFNAVYREFFSAPWPARSAFGANGLALGARMELEVFAVKRD